MKCPVTNGKGNLTQGQVGGKETLRFTIGWKLETMQKKHYRKMDSGILFNGCALSESRRDGREKNAAVCQDFGGCGVSIPCVVWPLVPLPLHTLKVQLRFRYWHIHKCMPIGLVFVQDCNVETQSAIYRAVIHCSYGHADWSKWASEWGRKEEASDPERGRLVTQHYSALTATYFNWIWGFWFNKWNKFNKWKSPGQNFKLNVKLCFCQ